MMSAHGVNATQEEGESNMKRWKLSISIDDAATLTSDA